MNTLTLIVDLDDTLYPADSTLWALMRNRIFQYISYRLNMSWNEARTLSTRFFTQYGTTLRGLQSVYQIDEDEFLRFVHDVPVWNFIQPAPALRAALLACSCRRVIFTNSDTRHVRRVLAAREMEDVFEEIIDIRVIAPYCKPMPESFRIMLDRIGEQPQNCLMIDDALPNLKTAHSLGMRTIWVSQEPNPGWVGGVIHRIEEAPQVVPLVVSPLEQRP